MWLQPLCSWFVAAALTLQLSGPALNAPTTPNRTAPAPTTSEPAPARTSPSPYAPATTPTEARPLTPTRAATTPDLPEPIAMRQLQFAIPFRIDRTGDSSWRPVEARLYFSTDRGEHWRFYTKAPAAQQRFPFRAGGDGEYWFAIRTADRSGRARPESIAGPALRIVIDTNKPALTMTAQAIEDGQVLVHWKVEEQNPRPNGLRVVYRPTSASPWTAVPVDPQAIDPGATTQAGDVIFRPKAASKEILVRAEFFDVAGNAAVAQTKVRLDRPVSTGGRVAGQTPVGVNPAIGNRYTPPGESSTRSAYPGVPAGEHPRLVNSTTFELAYEVDSVGPSGIGRVEVWGTRDAGRTWRVYGADNHNRSRVSVKVDDEGVYGFRLTATNGAGVGGKPPKDGDSPDVWIAVDATQPTAKIVSAEPGVDSEAGRLIISWQADDLHLAARPVSLSYSANRSGPWTTIAGGLDNNGRYAWPVDPRTPPRIYLRLEVRDEAGNVGVHETAEPVLIDQSSPTVRIRDVRATDQPPRRPEWHP